jgi:hypothetical protein
MNVRVLADVAPPFKIPRKNNLSQLERITDPNLQPSVYLFWLLQLNSMTYIELYDLETMTIHSVFLHMWHRGFIKAYRVFLRSSPGRGASRKDAIGATHPLLIPLMIVT